jgi:hypothetical protein
MTGSMLYRVALNPSFEATRLRMTPWEIAEYEGENVLLM